MNTVKKFLWVLSAIVLPSVMTSCDDDDDTPIDPFAGSTELNSATGQGYGSSNYSVVITDSVTKETLAMDMYCEGYKYLPSGTYTVTESKTDGKCIVNSNTAYTYYKKDADSEAVKIKSGTVTVTSDLETKKYTIYADLILDDTESTNVKMKYVGEIKGISIYDELNITLNACKRIDNNNPVPGEFYLKMNDSNWTTEMALSFVCEESALELTPGTYTVDSTDAAGTIRSTVSYIDYYPTSGLGGHLKSGQATVSKEDDVYAIHFDVTTENGQRFVGDYYDKVDNMAKPVEKAFNTATGQGYGSSNYSVTLSNSETQETLAMDMYCEGYKYLPSGTYTVAESKTGGKCVVNSSIAYTYYKKNADATPVKVVSGTVDVTADLETKKYTIVANLVVDDSETPNIKATYEGEISGISIYDEISLTLSACKRIDNNNNPVPGEFYLKMNDANWTTEMAMSFVCDATETELAPGTYTVASTDEAGTIRSSVSYLDYYPTSGLGGHYKSGQATVSKDGNTYTIKFDITTENDQRFVGEYTGEIAE